MTTQDTAGLASAYLWDISTSWSVASIGALDTGGTLTVPVREVEFDETEPPAPAPTEAAPPSEDVNLRDLMAKDPLFQQLTEKGLADLEANRFEPFSRT